MRDVAEMRGPVGRHLIDRSTGKAAVFVAGDPLGPGTPHEPFCCYCDEAGPIRCPRCGQWYCAKCFGADRAEAGGPCPDCTVKLARGGIY